MWAPELQYALSEMEQVKLSADAARAFAELERHDLLLLQDKTLPSLATLIAGEVVVGSWWGHPKARAIFSAAGQLDDHPDVTTAKLIAGRVTFIHRRLWAALVAVGGARAPWQLDGISAEAQELLDRVDHDGRVQATGAAAKQLERRLLVASEQVHTEAGAHATELMSWQTFLNGAGITSGLSEAAGRADIEEAVSGMCGGGDVGRLLPWRASSQR